MRVSTVFSCLAVGLAVCGALAWGPSARAEDRTADQVLKEIRAVEMPKVPVASQMNDRAVVTKYIADRNTAMSRRAELIGELYKLAPAHEALRSLMPARWQALQMSGSANLETLKAELADVKANAKNEALRTEAVYADADLTARMARGDTAAALKAVEAFITLAPKDERGAALLNSITYSTSDDAQQAELFRRILKDYPNSRSAKTAEANLRKLDSIGKPFDLEFTDAIKGTEVSMKALKGKVVVVDFWATWCGPCVAEMPKMKTLYSEYKDKGVVFIGVSLDAPKDQGGLDKLKAFVAEKEIAWPQYYQGNGWQSDFSSSWGINSIPAVFIIDTEGKLHSIHARGKLETMIPELLKKKAGANADAAGAGER